MQKKRTILLAILLVLLALIEGYRLFRSDALRFKNDYEFASFTRPDNSDVEVSIPRKNLVTYIDQEKLFETLEKETGIVYLGYPSCPWCQNIVEPLIEISNEYNVPIYYFNTKQKTTASFQEDFIDKYGTYLREVEGKRRVSSPDVYFVKNGTIVGHHIGTVASQKNPFHKMTPEQKEELLEIYRQLMTQLEEKE